MWDNASGGPKKSMCEKWGDICVGEEHIRWMRSVYDG